MDYGQNDQSNGAFFTEGVGVPSKNTDDFEAKNNLNLSNDAMSWSDPISHNSRQVGNKVIESQDKDISDTEEISINPELGKIIDLNMPPSAKGKTIENEDPSKIIEASFNKTAIKTDTTLNPGAVKEIDQAIIKFNQTGDAAGFYDTWRDAMEVNIDNSYNRKLDNGKLAA